MNDLWNLLEQIDGLTKALQTEIVSNRCTELPRDERRLVARKLREIYLRMGNVLEEWKDMQTPESTE